MILCQQCSNENTDDSDFCDRCGDRLVQDAKNRDSEIAESEVAFPKEDDSNAEVDPSIPLSRQLSESIKQKVNAGMPLDFAIEESCVELVAEPAFQQSRPRQDHEKQVEMKSEDCPVCGEENASDEAQCGKCGIVLKRTSEFVTCPKCGLKTCNSGKCECGTILTLSRLLEFVDPSVMSICRRCKQLYTAYRPLCSDCGGDLVPADRLKKYRG